MPDPIVIVEYEPSWPQEFERLRDRASRAVGGFVVAIEHVGSTAVPGLAAKPIIDIQIAVAAFEPLAAYRSPLEILGYTFRADNPDRTKRYFRESPGTRRTHIHVRQHGSWSEQFALLFRDFLRCHSQQASEYAALKLALIQEDTHDRRGYTEAKGPAIWAIMRQASDWSQEVGWEPGSTDA